MTRCYFWVIWFSQSLTCDEPCSSIKTLFTTRFSPMSCLLAIALHNTQFHGPSSWSFVCLHALTHCEMPVPFFFTDVHAIVYNNKPIVKLLVYVTFEVAIQFTSPVVMQLQDKYQEPFQSLRARVIPINVWLRVGALSYSALPCRALLARISHMMPRSRWTQGQQMRRKSAVRRLKSECYRLLVYFMYVLCKTRKLYGLHESIRRQLRWVCCGLRHMLLLIWTGARHR
jgi:hypothetical protein